MERHENETIGDIGSMGSDSILGRVCDGQGNRCAIRRRAGHLPPGRVVAERASEGAVDGVERRRVDLIGRFADCRQRADCQAASQKETNPDAVRRSRHYPAFDQALNLALNLAYGSRRGAGLESAPRGPGEENESSQREECSGSTADAASNHDQHPFIPNSGAVEHNTTFDTVVNLMPVCLADAWLADAWLADAWLADAWLAAIGQQEQCLCSSAQRVDRAERDLHRTSPARNGEKAGGGERGSSASKIRMKIWWRRAELNRCPERGLAGLLRA